MSRRAALSLLALALGCERAASAAPARIDGVETRLIAESAVSRFEELRITDTSGREFEFHLRRPRSATRPTPAVLVLAGFETGRQVLDLLEERDDLALLGMDYPFRGAADLHGLGFLWALPALRGMGFDTVDAGMLALDYLSSERSLFDPERLILLGVSFGSVLVAVLGGRDERARAVVLIYGGGNVPALARNAVRQGSPWLLAWLARPLARLFFGAFEPLDHVGKIAPRRLLMINSRKDELVPPSLAAALYERAGEPKKLVWYETGHMDLFDPDLIRRLTSHVLEELRAAGLLPPASPAGPVS